MDNPQMCHVATRKFVKGDHDRALQTMLRVVVP
jgi:hypothetical protein